MRERTRELLRVLNVTLRSLEYPVGSLSGGQRQAVAIARAIAWEQLVLILDEPTAALAASQKRIVMDLLRQLRIEHPSMAILLITHDLPRLHEVTDRVVVMRQGTVVADFNTEETDEHMLVTTMMGVPS
jgi:ABC-type sugar transport system ATPase subunit